MANLIEQAVETAVEGASKVVVSDKRNTVSSSWKIRRRIIYASLLFCAFCISYALFKGTDTRILETVVTSAFTLAGMIIGSYVFGAVYEDTRKNNG